MNFLRNIFSPRLYAPSEELVQQYFKEVKFYSKTQIIGLYPTLMNEYVAKGENTSDFLTELIRRLNNETKTICQTTKLFTLIHCFVVERTYNKQDIQSLQSIQFSLKLEDNQLWFEQFSSAYMTYLLKMPSMSDIYSTAQKKPYETAPDFHLTHIFRIINQCRTLFPFITKAVNVVGRYQSIKHSEFRELYRIISAELVILYSYLNFLTEQIMHQYKAYNPIDLKCFLDSIPEMETICDRIEDLLVNKYLRGKKVNSKIEFKEESVAELKYYLQYEFQEHKSSGKAENQSEISQTQP